MLNDLYRRARQEGHRAQDALRLAKYQPRVNLSWDTYGERATFERDGFTYTVTAQPDDFTEMDWLGEFTNTPDPGAVKNPNHYERGAYEWFVPAYTYAERVRDLRSRGMSRGVADYEARKAIHRDAHLATELVDHVIQLTVSRNGIALATSYLGGVTFGDSYEDNQKYIAETVEDMLDEATDEARATLRTLCDEAQ